MQPPPRLPLLPYTTLFRSPIALERVGDLQRVLAEIPKTELKAIPDISGARIPTLPDATALLDRKSTRLNSSHLVIAYAVFCVKKKNIQRAAAASACVPRFT